MASHLRAFRAERPSLSDEPKYWTRVPDDALEDPRLSGETIHVFGQLLKGNRSTERVLRITQAELGLRCRLSARMVSIHLHRLEATGYIRRERDYSRDRDRNLSPFIIHLCFELRAALKLEDGPPVTSGSRSAPNRKQTSACMRKQTSACNRKETSGPSLFEQRIKRDDDEKAPEPGSSSSFRSSEGGTGPGEPEPPSKAPESPLRHASPPEAVIVPPEAPTAPRAAQDDPSMAGMLSRAVARWPSAAAELPARVADLVAIAQTQTGYGTEGAELAVEYTTRLPAAKDLGQAFWFLKRWWGDGQSLDNVRTIVECRRKLDEPVKRGPPPPPGPFVAPEVAPETAEEAQKKAEWLARWRARDFAACSEAGEGKPAAEPATKQSPQPAGVARPQHDDLTVNIDPRQEKSAEKQAFACRAGPVNGPEHGGFS